MKRNCTDNSKGMANVFLGVFQIFTPGLNIFLWRQDGEELY